MMELLKLRKMGTNRNHLLWQAPDKSAIKIQLYLRPTEPRPMRMNSMSKKTNQRKNSKIQKNQAQAKTTVQKSHQRREARTANKPKKKLKRVIKPRKVLKMTKKEAKINLSQLDR